MKDFFENHKIVHGVLCFLFFFAGVTLVIIGQKHIGPSGILMMLIGVAVLVGLLSYYNHFYT